MNFQNLIRIEDADTYLDIAFSRAKKASNEERSAAKGTRIRKSVEIEISRLKTINKSLLKHLKHIIINYPSFDQLDDFYKELIKLFIDYKELKLALGAVNWAAKNIEKFFNVYSSRIKACKDLQAINKYRREYYGRVCSVMKQIKKQLVFLESCRRTLKGFPVVKTGIPTVAIYGFPNVGKTTLLSKLTGSKPDIQSYAFTTKNLNLGYIRTPKGRIQLLDTPGTLNRDDKMNYIEKIAELALKHCATTVIYVFDLTESYPIKEQMQLYRKLKKMQKNVLVYLSKTDILDQKKIGDWKQKKIKTFSIDSLKEELIKLLKAGN